MIAGIDIHVLNRLSVVLLPVLLMTLVKAAILFAIVLLLIRAFSVTSARVRYVLWTCYVFIVVFIAIYTVISPTLNLRFLQIDPHKFEKSKILTNILLPQYETWGFAKDYTIGSSTYMQGELNLSSESIHWSFWTLFGWITGFVLCLLYALTGRIGVQFISRSVSSHGSSYITGDICSLARDLGIERKVKIVVSSRCRLPFTYGFIHPVLVIPYEVKNWPKSKLRTVLIHELAHIRRNDYLLLLLSRFICFIFWFIPVMWIAHSKLQIEQENLCDLVTIQKGERPTVYARHMIDLARTTRSLVQWSAIFIMKGRNKLLEKRVTNVLTMKRLSLRGGDSTMKIRTLPLILILVFTVLILAGSYATGQKAISTEDAAQILSGKWANEVCKYALFVVYPDGRYEVFYEPLQERLFYSGISNIYDSWRDSEGVLWYRAFYQNSLENEGYILGKISNSDNTWEHIYTTSKDRMIDEWIIGKVDHNYLIFSRQE